MRACVGVATNKNRKNIFKRSLNFNLLSIFLKKLRILFIWLLLKLNKQAKTKTNNSKTESRNAGETGAV